MDVKRRLLGITLHFLIACNLFGQTTAEAFSKRLKAEEPERRRQLVAQWRAAIPHVLPFSNAVYVSVSLCGISPLEAQSFDSKDLESDLLKRMAKIDDWGGEFRSHLPG
jgi:hypothetical protein